jgi:metal-responsive CopG/Arc/MetJ family transcriptional regulator
MKIITISIDEPTLVALDRLAGKGRGRRKRSELVREALAEFLARREEQEAIERAAIAKHRVLLACQAKSMVAEQARPRDLAPEAHRILAGGKRGARSHRH